MSAWLAAKRSGVRSPSAPPFLEIVMKKAVGDMLEKTIQTIKEADISGILEDAKKKIEDISKNPLKHASDIIKQAGLAYDMIKCYLDKKCDFPWRTVAALAAALLYLINPFDVVPDFIPGIGYVDDLAAFAVAFALIKEDLKAYAAFHNINLEEYGLD